MIATDSAEETETPVPVTGATPTSAKAAPALKIEIGSESGFTDLFDQQMIRTVKESASTSASAVDHLVGRTIAASDNLEIVTELRSIRQMLNGMMITHPEGLKLPRSRRTSATSPGRILLKAIQELHGHMVGLDAKDAVTSFINALADRVVHRDAESVFASRIIFVIGSSGTGKTTLATKIAAYFKERGISDRIMLAAAAGPGISASEEINSYARLLNMRAAQFGIGEVSTAVQETSNRIVIDVNAAPEDAITAIHEVMQRQGTGKVTVVQAIPGGSSANMIEHQCKLYRRLSPMIALTKLDECEAMPAELSTLALDGSGVGLLTGTKSIVDGIAIATMPILAQYLQENATS